MSKIIALGKIRIASRLQEPDRTKELNRLFDFFLKTRDKVHCIETAELLNRSFSPAEVKTLIGI